jgi:cyclohexyl-isocyanide hydratase
MADKSYFDLYSKGRRLFLGSMAAAAAGAASGPVSAQSSGVAEEQGSDRKSGFDAIDHTVSSRAIEHGIIAQPKIAMLVHPKMVAQDLIGPWTVFNLMRGSEIHLVWKNLEPVSTELGLPITPTTTLADCPSDLDVLFVPGGLEGSILVMEDNEVLDFLRDRGERARYVTSDCTGSLVLGAAGLLRGYRATGHWYIREHLQYLGAIPVNERIVADRNRITGGGVTAGIDFGLTLAALLRGRETAEHYQLILEYAPEPPFNAGTPETAPQSAYDHVMMGRGPVIEVARESAIRIGKTLEAG